ncbi:MAG: UbiA family prenyltransferase, partial [Planctomycetota bacterium]
VYTYGKRVWAFAAVPGALVGAIPPAVGWTAAGGSLADGGVLALALFFFLWQVPHFWFLLLAFARDYDAAGLPSPVERVGEEALVRLASVWSLSAAGSSLLLRAFGAVASPEGALLLLLAGAAFAAGSLGALRTGGGEASLRRAFSRANAYAAAVLAIVVLDALAVL